MSWFKQKRSPTAPSLPLLNTERLVLRGFETGDAVSVYAYAQSEKVAGMAGFAPHKTVEDSRAMVQTFMEKEAHWAIVEKATGSVIGSISLQTDGKRPKIENARRMGYVLGEKYWGRGYATEACREILRYAFEDVGCPVISADLFPANIKSKRVLKKLGFMPDGVIRYARLLPYGTPSDMLTYSLLKTEYEANNKTK